MKVERRWSRACHLGVVLALGVGCALSADSRKARHLARGDAYFEEKKYRESVLEYRNVLSIEPANPHAVRRLGLAHFEQGELGPALPYLLRAVGQEPQDAGLRLRLGQALLASGRLEDAHGHASAILEREPDRLDALVLAAEAASTPEQVEAARQGLLRVADRHHGQAPYQLALGMLQVKRNDAAAAERAFSAAVEAAPRSVSARLALANLHLVRRQLGPAEEHLKVAAALGPAGSEARIRLADFYLQSGRTVDARKVLSDTTSAAPDYLPAWLRLAEVAFEEGRYDDAEQKLDVILDKSPGHPEALVLRGRVRLAKGEVDRALNVLNRVIEHNPRLPPAHYALGLAHLQAGNLLQAKQALKQAATLYPDYAEAVVLLAELDLRSGAAEAAIAELRSFVARNPGAADAHRVLGSAYLASRRPAEAEAVFRKLLAVAPDDARSPHLLGLALRAQGRDDARQRFEAALEKDPAYADPMLQLVTLDLAAGRPAAALARLEQQLARAPEAGGLHYLLGKLRQEQGARDAAEAAFRKAIELEPNLLAAYSDLARLYQASGRAAEAVAQLQAAVGRTPRNPTLLVLLGLTQESQGDLPSARASYEKALEVAPRLAPAANNLAWILSEHGGDAEKALQLAQTAREEAPEDPYVADTLGWILYKRGVYHRAVGLLRESAEKLADNADVQLHLGMALLRAGQRGEGQAALRRALELNPALAGAEAARQALAAVAP